MNSELPTPFILLILLMMRWKVFGIVVMTVLSGPLYSTPNTRPVTLPITFEANRGQAASDVQYISSGRGYGLFFTSAGATLVMATGESVQMKFPGANFQPAIEASDLLRTTTNYFIGTRARWRSNIPRYRRIRYNAIYPGIDVNYYGNDGQLEYDFIVGPGASPRKIAMTFEGAKHVRLNSAGDLRLVLHGEEILLRKPVAYQQRSGKRSEVAAEYVLRGKRVGIRMGSYDPHEPLIIDPVLNYASYLGGTGNDNASAVAVDPIGNTYVVGTTFSADFPTANALRPDFGEAICGVFVGAFGRRNIPCSHAFVAKLAADGSAVYLTFFGGDKAETGTGVAVDSAGNVYVTGTTSSTNFPLVNPLMTRGNSFVAKLNPQGSALIYSTRFGGSGEQTIKAIAVDREGNAFVTGGATSTDFPFKNPVPAGTCSRDMAPFVAKINPLGSALVYSTCLSRGGPSIGNGIAIDASGDAYITGQTVPRDLVTFNAAQPSPGRSFDAFVTKLDAAGALIYSTYLGGGDQDLGFGIAADIDGNAYVTGDTISDDFPTSNALQSKRASGDAFITKLDAAGSIVYSTYFGGNGLDTSLGIATYNFGNAYSAGRTSSSDLPTVNPIQPTPGGGSDAFVAKLNASGSSVLFSTYLGGSADETDGHQCNKLGIALRDIHHKGRRRFYESRSN